MGSALPAALPEPWGEPQGSELTQLLAATGRGPALRTMVAAVGQEGGLVGQQWAPGRGSRAGRGRVPEGLREPSLKPQGAAPACEGGGEEAQCLVDPQEDLHACRATFPACGISRAARLTARRMCGAASPWSCGPADCMVCLPTRTPLPRLGEASQLSLILTPMQPWGSSLGWLTTCKHHKETHSEICCISASPGDVPSGAGEPGQGRTPGQVDEAEPNGSCVAASRGTWPQRCVIGVGHQVWLKTVWSKAGFGVLLALWSEAPISFPSSP